jgi:competence protein ComEA
MDADTPPGRARIGIGVGAGIVLVLVVLVVTVLVSALAPRGTSEVVVPNPSAGTGGPLADGAVGQGQGPDADGSAGEPAIFVHVLGSVAVPGLYELRDGARVVDAIAAAGGYTAAADQTQLNLARLVDDGEQLYAPAVGETPPQPPAGTAAAASGGASSTLIDLNTADAASLEQLPRVGPETAKKIIAYRDEQGPFTSVDQLLEVPGIGQKTLDGLRDAATV